MTTDPRQSAVAAVRRVAAWADCDAAWAYQADLLRTMFGNPFEKAKP